MIDFKQIPCDTPDDCRFSCGPMSSTLLAWIPQFDRDGNALNDNPNTTSGTVSCSHCNKTWATWQRPDGLEIREL